MDTILLFDIGNTHINLGAFEGDKLVATWRITTRVEATPDEYAVLLKNLLRQKNMNGRTFAGGAIASSVPSIVPTFAELCQRYLGFSPLVITAGIKAGLRVLTDNPREVGADRIANALAAKTLYGAPAVVIDFSTATIFDAIDADGDYVGATFAPGISLSADALFRAAAQLARVEIAPPPGGDAIGKNSVHSVQAGLVYGYVGLVEGLVRRIKNELGGTAKVIALGEQVDLIARHTQVIDVIDENVTLQGLRLIYEMNRS
ncbi:MAG TPA: type III pantothenate kinase [Anaerolineae bacterium]